jgi:hypothetical protein
MPYYFYYKGYRIKSYKVSPKDLTYYAKYIWQQYFKYNILDFNNLKNLLYISF